VQPPAEVLASILTVRLHLDDADEAGGALKVVPGSHRYGRLSPAEIQRLKGSAGVVTCAVKRGGALLMRPLLLHASSAAARPLHRRVLHLEYSAHKLPGGLEWYGS
jgi:ectoine hydroxylase-related dioxygenase (phytanoyl-CoA dioxygenase family)